MTSQTLEEHWELVRSRLHAELGPDVFDNWLKGIHFEECEEGVVRLSIATAFLQQYVTRHYGDKLLRLWQEAEPTLRQVTVTIRGIIGKPQSTETEARPIPTKSVVAQSRPAPHAGNPSLNPFMTLERFRTDESDGFIRSMCRHFASAHRLDTGNLLLIHGPSGVGKTHLLHAMGHAAIAAGKRAWYVHTTQEIEHGHGDGAEILLVDNVQEVEKDSTIAALSRTICRFLDTGRRIVLAANASFGDLHCCNERARALLSTGVVVALRTFSTSVRLQIVEDMIAGLQLTDQRFVLAPEHIQQIASCACANGHMLQGVLLNLLARQVHGNIQITTEVVAGTLADVEKYTTMIHKVSVADIQRTTAQHYKVTRRDMLSERRTRTLVRPRHVAMYLAKKLTPQSLPHIGRQFGNRDHTTVLHAIKKVEDALPHDAQLREDIRVIEEILLS